MKKNSQEESAAENRTTRLIIAGLIALAVVQVAVVIVLIYVGTHVGDLSSDVDDIKSEQSGLTNTDPKMQKVSSNNTLIFNDDLS